ncbi:ABC transporter permease [Gulosibacter sediminis]|uniref:ABC transporter permease n=1 Tax=Gulosibacter sediminis TaxID=1729695 RepID=UPI0024AD79A5|nr:ABC transporter permease [Gulosibacter sediminis]
MTQQNTSPRTISVMEGVRLVAGREISTAVRAKAMWWSLISIVAIIAVVLLGGRFLGDVMSAITGGNGEDQQIGTTLPESTLPADAIAGDLVRIGSVDDAVAQLESGELDALVLRGADATGLELHAEDGEVISADTVANSPYFVVVGKDSVPDSLAQSLTLTPLTGSLEFDQQQIPQFMMMFVALGYGLVFFLAIMLYAQRLSQSIVEEKASRIVELLVSTVKPGTILAGKIVGGTVLAMVQVIVIVAAALICLAVAGNLQDVPDIGVSLVWFSVLTLLGFMFYASMYAALSATVSRPEDVASVTAPLTYLLMIPYIGPMLGFQNDTLMTWLSYIPVSSPVAMPLRILQGNAAWWEPLAATAVMVVFVVAVIWLAGRIYRNSVLRTGTRVKLADALRS